LFSLNKHNLISSDFIYSYVVYSINIRSYSYGQNDMKAIGVNMESLPFSFSKCNQ